MMQDTNHRSVSLKISTTLGIATVQDVVTNSNKDLVWGFTIELPEGVQHMTFESPVSADDPSLEKKIQRQVRAYATRTVKRINRGEPLPSKRDRRRLPKAFKENTSVYEFFTFD